MKSNNISSFFSKNSSFTNIGTVNGSAVAMGRGGGGRAPHFGLLKKNTVFGISRNYKTTENDGKTINNVQT